MLHTLHSLSHYQLFIAFAVCVVLFDVYHRNWYAMPGDAALLVLGSLGWFALVWALTLFLARHWRGWCNDVGQTWPLVAYRALWPALDAVTPAQVNTGSTRPLSLKEWMAYVNDKPQTVPHVVVVGGSGAGKTTTTTVLLDRRQGDIIIMTGKDGDRWGGLTAIGIDDDLTYTTVIKTFAALHEEIKRRQLAVKHGDAPGEYLNVVLDDFSTLQQVCKQAIETVKIIWRIGRSLRVRLVMLTDSTEVKSIGLEGEGEARTNAVYVELRQNHTADLYRVDRSGRAVDRQPVDVKNMHKLETLIHFPPTRAWEPPHMGITQPLIAPTVNAPSPDKVAALRPLRAAGLKREDVRALGVQFSNEDWTAAA